MRSSARFSALQHLVDIGDVADHARSRRDPCAVEMMRDLRAHDLGLLDHLRGERSFLRARLVPDHAERRLERVREIADMGARPIDDLAIGLDQRVQLLLERSDLVGRARLRASRPRPSGSRRGSGGCALSGESPKRTWK